MTEQEIFEKLKEALDYQYLFTNWGGILTVERKYTQK
jgi:hypothetical protein